MQAAPQVWQAGVLRDRAANGEDAADVAKKLRELADQVDQKT
jgi:hypothetical protein